MANLFAIRLAVTEDSDEVNWEEVEEMLHDAEIDLDYVRLDGRRVLTMHGLAFRASEHGLQRVSKHSFRLPVKDVTDLSVDDPDEVGCVVVSDVARNGDEWTIVSAMAGSIRFRSPSDVVELNVDPRPAFTRRWFRWRPVT